MILGGSKDPVVENMEKAAGDGRLNCKVEVEDPAITLEEGLKLVEDLNNSRGTFGYRVCNRIDRFMVDIAGAWVNRKTKCDGLENIRDIKTGAIITSNHFNPDDTSVVRTAIKKVGKDRMFTVSQEENLAMPGIVGFLMKYTDIIPMSRSAHYMARTFPKLVEDLMSKKEWLLIYPEEEMWLNYRKPRPLQRGPYYYAHKFDVPIVSCFVELREAEGMETEEFKNTRCIIHVLPPIYPDQNVNLRDDSERMMAKDYEQKKEAYEKSYGKKLTYDFSYDDVAGWVPPKDRKRK